MPEAALVKPLKGNVLWESRLASGATKFPCWDKL
jgi:hypothetical protein